MTAGNAPIRTRNARSADVDAIVEIIRPYAGRGLVLDRTATDIEGALPDFLVAEKDGELIGCVSLRDFGGGLLEIRTLAVREERHGHGVGTFLVRAAIHQARERRARRLFALTVRPNLFERLDFAVVPKSRFPAKVWSDCRFCNKREHCDETAVVLPLDT